jgi:hypothetical protein
MGVDMAVSWICRPCHTAKAADVQQQQQAYYSTVFICLQLSQLVTSRWLDLPTFALQGRRSQQKDPEIVSSVPRKQQMK